MQPCNGVSQVVSFEHAKAKLHAAVQRLIRGDLEAETELEEWDASSLRLRCAKGRVERIAVNISLA